MRFGIPLLLSLLLGWIGIQPVAAFACSTRIDGFDLRGAEKTHPYYLRLWSGLAIGQKVDRQDLDAARQRLMDTALYLEVSVVAESPCSERSRIVIAVREKHYHLIYPRASRNGDGDIDLGLRYRGSNLFGRGQSIALLLSKKDYANGDSADRFQLDYDLPLWEPPYRFQTRLYRADTLLGDSETLATETLTELRLSIGRDWHPSQLDEPVTVYALLGLKRKALDKSSPDLGLEPGVFNTLGIRLVIDQIHRSPTRRFGRYFSLEFNQGIFGLGSDYEASLVRFEGRHYWPLNDTDNINLRYILGLASEKVFNQSVFTIGGAATVRGIESDSVEGNGLWLTNLEYLKGFEQWPSFRLALFTDIANVFDRYNEFSGKPWQTTIGLGLRWKIRSFVKTDLFIDYGFDPDSGYSRFYAGTHLSF